MTTPSSKRIIVELTRDLLNIYIDEFLHLHLAPRKPLQFQSWIQNDPPTSAPYCIEYYVNGDTILTEYESRETWTSILIQLNNLMSP